MPVVANLLAHKNTLKKRRDFLRLARRKRIATAGFVLQMDRGEADKIRLGFTCSKKVGNAVARNRAKRRLRALAGDIIPLHGQIGHDYVLIGRAEKTAMLPFAQMQKDLIKALKRIHA